MPKKRIRPVLRTRGAEEKKLKYKIPPDSKKAIKKYEKAATKKEVRKEKDLKKRFASNPETRKKSLKQFMKDPTIPRSVKKRRMTTLSQGVKEDLENAISKK